MKNKENFLYSEKEIIKAFGKKYVMYTNLTNVTMNEIVCDKIMKKVD